MSSAENSSNGTVVVTGASRGIGAAIATRFAADGFDVACAATSAANAEPVARQIAEAYDVATMAVEMRVESHSSVVEAIDAVEVELGSISVLVNNAGIGGVDSLLDYSADDFGAVIDINLKGVFHCAQVAGQRMVASGTAGSIVNIGSIAGTNAFPKRVAYCGSKAAVHQMTKVMALDLADHGIRVNAVAPGYIRTDLIQELVDAGKLDETTIAGRVPLGSFGEGDDIAAAVAWIASNEARYVTGETLTVDGGWLAYGHV